MTSTSLKPKGFTMLELILVMTIFTLIFTTTSFAFGSFYNRYSLKSYGYRLVQDIREARVNSLTRWQNDQWGVYFNDASLPHSYTFFKGPSYASRDPDFDRVTVFPDSLRFDLVNLSGQKQIAFTAGVGDATHPGYAQIVSDDNEDYLISINPYGLVEHEL